MTKKQTGLTLLVATLSLALFLLLQTQSGSPAARHAGRTPEDPGGSAALPRVPDTTSDGLPAADHGQRIPDGVTESPDVKEAPGIRSLDVQPLRGTVVDESQRLLPGVEVQLCISGAPAGARLDFRARQTVQLVQSVESDSGGAFHFDLPVGVPHILRIPPDPAAGRASVELSPCFAGQAVTLLVPLAGRVEGRIFTAAGELPVNEALVRLWGDRDSAFGPLRSGLDGRFVFSDLPPGDYICQVFPREHRRPPSVQLSVERGETSQIRIEVEPGLTLHGRITDSASGAPIEGAVIREGYVSPRDTARSDAAGEYVLRGVGWQLRTTIFVEAEGFGAAEALAPLADADADEAWMNFELTAGRAAVGRVLGPAGKPLEGVKVGAAASDPDAKPSRLDWCSDLTGGEGHFEIRGIRKDMQHVLSLSKAGYGTRVYDFPANEAREDVVRFGDLRMFSAARLEGRVVHDDGTPVPNATVLLVGSNSDRTRFGRLGLRASGIDFHVARTEHQTDPNGAFRFGGLSGGEWTLSATDEGTAGIASRTLQLEDGELRDSLELVISRGSFLAGRVVDPAGRGVAGARISAREPGGRGLQATSGEDGAYRLNGLFEESYDLRLRAPFIDDRESTDAPHLYGTWFVNVSAGQADLELRLLAAVTLRGQVLGQDGEPLAQAWVELQDAEQRFLARVIADGQGHFELDGPASVAVRVVASASMPDERTVSGRSRDMGAALGVRECTVGEGAEVLIRIP